MRETVLGQLIGALGPLRTPEDLQALAENEAKANGTLGPQFTTPPQALVRELTRDVIHPLFFRSETTNPFGGLDRLHDLQDKGFGAVTVEMHFSQIDPAWAIHAVTKKGGKRSIPIVQPIASDRAPFGLVPFVKFAGVDLMKVVTPDVKERADAKNPDNSVIVGEGRDEFIAKAIEVVRDGGMAFIPQQATRENQLTLNDRDQAVATLLLAKLFRNRVKDVAVHFVAFDMKGLNGHDDFHKNRRYNIGKKHSVIHGNTYTLEELFDLAASYSDENDKGKLLTKALPHIESVVFEELKQIVPPSYLPTE